MRIFNKTKNRPLVFNLSIAESFIDRLKGLLGRKHLPDGEGVLLKPCCQIHTWFMKFPIDVLFLDKNYLVRHIIRNLKPFRISGIYFKAQNVVELPSGTIEKTKTEVGDLLVIEK